MNKTVKAEGAAYRGRVLLELRTVLGERPTKPVEDILHEDILRVQVTDLYTSQPASSRHPRSLQFSSVQLQHLCFVQVIIV